MGFAFKSTEFTDNPEDVRLLRGANIAQGRLKWGQERRFPAGRYDEYEKCHLRAADVVLAMDRPWIDAGLKWAVVSKDDVPALLVQRVARLRGTTTLAHEFVRYVIGSPEFEAYIQPIVTGVNVPHISGSQIEDFRFRLPPLHAQQKIARALGGLDDLIENNRRRIEILEEMARLIYREWFVHFRFPRHEDVELVDSDLGPIPEGWDVTPASTAFEVNPRERLNNDAEHRFLTMGDLSETGMVCWPSALKAGTSGAKFRNGDTLFARITPCLENGKTGFVACLDDGEIGRGSTEFVVLRGGEVGPEFTYLTARKESFRENAIKSMTGASGRQRVRNECFDSHLLVVPTVEVEMEFRESVRPMFELVFSLARQNQVLAEARDLLLPRLISGELDVSELDLALKPVA